VCGGLARLGKGGEREEGGREGEKERTLVEGARALLALGVVGKGEGVVVVAGLEELLLDDVDEVLLDEDALAPEDVAHGRELLAAVPLARHLDVQPAAEPALDRVVVELVQLGEAAVDLGVRVEQERVGRQDEERGVDEGGREGGELCELREREGAACEEDAGDLADGRAKVLVDEVLEEPGALLARLGRARARHGWRSALGGAVPVAGVKGRAVGLAGRGARVGGER